ncbi:hypothetical protein [Streptomyces vinaceus]|uniref:hypothetical protein n=1 Tax=Streptomyces vinaceus TaxID=1960 RepID=UPI0038219311
MADASDCEKVAPWLQEQVARYEKALAESTRRKWQTGARGEGSSSDRRVRHGVGIANEVAQYAAGRIADGTL